MFHLNHITKALDPIPNLPGSSCAHLDMVPTIPPQITGLPQVSFWLALGSLELFGIPFAPLPKLSEGISFFIGFHFIWILNKQGIFKPAEG